MTTAVAPAVPAHVPRNLVELFSFHEDTGFKHNPHDRLEELRKLHRVFYTPFSRGLTGQGTWVFTRGEDMRAVLRDTETFASGGLRPFAQAIGEDWTLIPVDLDPPLHAKFRRILNPLFSPSAMKRLDEKVNIRAAENIAAFVADGECDFITAFARPYPVSIFLELMGLPLSEMAKFIRIEDALIHGTPQTQLAGIREARDFLVKEIDARRSNLGDDLISHALKARIDDQPLTADEVLGISFMMFLGGLDTVTSTLGYMFRHLAEHPQDQQQLRDDSALIPDAVEELLRLYNVVTTGRRATRDVDFAGVHIKAGDLIAMPTNFASRDPAEFDEPSVTRFERSPNRHSAFGFGIHHCLGSQLARRELVAAVREWLAAVPPFRLKDGAQLRSSGSGVVALHTLPLVWR